MGWEGNFIGAFFGILPGAFIGDILEEGEKHSKKKI